MAHRESDILLQRDSPIVSDRKRECLICAIGCDSRVSRALETRDGNAGSSSTAMQEKGDATG